MDDDTPRPAEDPDAFVQLLRSRLEEGDLELPVNGSSMRGVIESGSTVTVTATRGPRHGEVWAFSSEDGRLIVHRIRHLGANTITLRGVGNPVDDQPVPRSRLIGRVILSRSPSGAHRFGTRDRMAAAVTFRIRAAARRAGLAKRQD